MRRSSPSLQAPLSKAEWVAAAQPGAEVPALIPAGAQLTEENYTGAPGGVRAQPAQPGAAAAHTDQVQSRAGSCLASRCPLCAD